MNTVDLALARPGRRAEPPTAKIVRDLNEADLAARRLVPAAKPAPLQSLRDSHHHLARTLASDVSDTEASAITGYTPNRISILKNDPAFKELLEFYRKQQTGLFETVQDRFTALMLDCVSVIQERVEKDPDAITLSELRETAKFASGPAGYGPMTKSLNVNMNIDYASRLSEARKRSSPQPSDARLIEGVALPAKVEPQAAGEVPGKASPAVISEDEE